MGKRNFIELSCRGKSCPGYAAYHQPSAGPFKADWVIDPGVPVSFEPATVNRAGGQPCAHPLNSRIEFPCPQWRRAGLANATCCFSFNIYRIVN